jgi:hypothetical protein
MKNAWLNHVRQLRKQNRNMSYKSLLQKARQSYGGGPADPMNQQNQQNQRQGGADPAPAPAVPPASSLQNAMNLLRRGGSYQGIESRSSLTRSASSVGGRRSRRHTRRRRR